MERSESLVGQKLRRDKQGGGALRLPMRGRIGANFEEHTSLITALCAHTTGQTHNESYAFCGTATGEVTIATLSS